VLHRVLGVDLGAFRAATSVGAPFSVPDGPCGALPQVDCAAAAARARQLSWVPPVEDYVALKRFLRGPGKPGVGPEPVLPQQYAAVLDAVAPDGSACDLDALVLGSTLEALACTCETDLVDKVARVALGPLPGDIAAVAAYAQRLADRAYEADYADRLKQKRADEDRLRLDAAVSAAVAASDPANFQQQFWDQLAAAGIHDRSAPGYSKLVDQLVKNPDAPLCGRKLWGLLTGRRADGEPVWASGNLFRGNMAPFEAAFAVIDPTGDRWRRFLAFQKKYRTFAYKRGEEPNRHGFSEKHPSWFALGYKSLADFQAQAPEEFAAWSARDELVRPTKCAAARFRARTLRGRK
jgi:hypothetical protein